MARQIAGIDSSIFIYVWERNPEFLGESKKLLNKIIRGSMNGIFAEIGLIEVITGPKKLGRPSLASLYKHRIQKFPHLETKDLNDNSIDIAASLRAKYGLRTPDAIHLATAIDAGASVFYTNDQKLKKIQEIRVKTL